MKYFSAFRQNKIHYQNFFLLLIICLLAYWPLTFGIFSVKNDAIHEFLPYRFNIAEAIRNGEMPFWSPYIYLGNPVYGDMQGGAWNPFVWFFSLFGRYTIFTFHFENILYIFLGAAGMYKLTHFLTGHTRTALLIATGYMLSGFMLSGQLIHWLAAAGIIPYVIFYYLSSLKKPSIINGAKTGIALFFLFTTAYPSFFILTGYLLFAHILVIMASRFRTRPFFPVSSMRFIALFLTTAVVFIGLSLPAIVSYLDMLPYYSRGSGTSYQDTLSNSFELRHLITLFFPGVLNTSDMHSATDITSRNVYIGIFPMIILAAFPPKLNRRNSMLLLLAVFSLLFSLGGATPIRKFCYDFIPLMDTFRHPSQIRLFFILALLLLAAPGITKYFDHFTLNKTIRPVTLVFFSSICLITLFTLFDSKIINEIFYSDFLSARDTLKKTISGLSFTGAVAISGCIQIFFTGLFLWSLKKYPDKKKWFPVLWIANLLILAQLALPVSFVSKTSAKEINALIKRYPDGFPVSTLNNSLSSNSADAFNEYDKVSLLFFYNKKIGISRIAYTPSFIDEQGLFLDTRLLYDYVASKPVVYIADSIIQLKDTSTLKNINSCNYAVSDSVFCIKGSCENRNNATITKMSSNRFEIETINISPGVLILTQTYYHHWKAWVDGSPAKILKVNSAFMGIYMNPGNHNVIFKFVPGNTIKAIWVMVSVTLILVILFLFTILRRQKI